MLCICRFKQLYLVNRGGTVDKGLCYKSEGRWFDQSVSSRDTEWMFSANTAVS